MLLLHATSIAIDNKAVVLCGPAGVGKSDLALRLMDEGATLIADDQTQLHVQDGQLLALPPERIAGLIEVRHVGLMRAPFVAAVPVALCVDLVDAQEGLERLPEADSILLLDYAVPRLRLPSFAASTPAKIRACLSYPLMTDTFSP